uniref:Disintegrin and metalloproteinase domain-containing protein 22 n=1 Tax=Caenorhabditis tropicalis TaxID=1561998 RepID=A0A1I7UPF9_9PELO
MDAISYMLESLNVADSMLSRDLNIRLSAVYVELWSDVQRIDLWEDIERTLSGVVDYTAGHIYHIQKDATILFTAGSFANQEASNAAIRSICTARSAVIVRSIEQFATHWNGELVAQSIGHLLGLEHDTTACSCEPSPECLMRQQPGRLGAPFSWQFSKCSVARMHGIWQDGNIQCLLNKPFQVSELRECGNGIVDGAEECDCGTRENCNDPCCDPLTCTLRPHAQCAAHHKCCHRCELRKAGETCRASQSPCDVAESCDGKSGDCPPDGHLIDGTVCGTDGQCWRGNCSDSHLQCQKLWGRDARLADPVCFDQNTKGAEYANCGVQADGSYHPCRLEDTKCGTLHCHSGSITPLDQTLKAFTFHFSQNSQQIQCKSIAGGIATVPDGTNCGSGRVCVASSCVEMSSVTSPTTCPTNNLALLCSGHGHCTTTAKCVCFNGWAGTACDIRSNTSTYQGQMGFSDSSGSKDRKTIMIPHLNIGTTLETATLFAILLGFGVFLLLCLVCLMLCYRRRSVVEIPKPSDEKMEESPDRQIKFGNMPSYREEKRKRKSNKRIYGALNRITEADERDSTSLRSRDSAGSQQLLDRNGQPVMIRDPYASEHHIYAESSSTSAPQRQFRGINSDGSYPLRSFGSWRSSGPISPASSSGHLTDVSSSTTPLRLNKIGKLLKTMQQSDDETSPFSDHPLLGRPGFQPTYSNPEEELSAVEADHDVGSNTESSRGCEDGPIDGWDPPSIVNGSSSNFQFRQSPSLFSDPFKLEMTNSMHN